MARRRAEPTLKEEIAESGETPADLQAAAERADREDYRFVAREFLTWLAFHAEVDGGSFKGEGDVAAFTLSLGSKIVLRTMAGPVTDVTLKGPAPAGSPDLRYAFAGGLSVKEADLVLEQDDRRYTFGLAAEHLDLKRVKLPALLTEEDDDRADERLALLTALDAAVELAFRRFLDLRANPAWGRQVIPALREWLTEGT